MCTASPRERIDSAQPSSSTRQAPAPAPGSAPAPVPPVSSWSSMGIFSMGISTMARATAPAMPRVHKHHYELTRHITDVNGRGLDRRRHFGEFQAASFSKPLPPAFTVAALAGWMLFQPVLRVKKLSARPGLGPPAPAPSPRVPRTGLRLAPPYFFGPCRAQTPMTPHFSGFPTGRTPLAAGLIEAGGCQRGCPGRTA